jgi:hypothetical protein
MALSKSSLPQFVRHTPPELTPELRATHGERSRPLLWLGRLNRRRTSRLVASLTYVVVQIGVTVI